MHVHIYLFGVEELKISPQLFRVTVRGQKLNSTQELEGRKCIQGETQRELSSDRRTVNINKLELSINQ